MAEQSEPNSPTIVGRLRSASTSVINYHVQQGMWAATGTVIAHAPSLGELREPTTGGKNITYNYHGHSARHASVSAAADVPLVLTGTTTKASTILEEADNDRTNASTDRATAVTKEKHNWKETTQHALAVAWKFVTTPTGFLMTLYGLNVVAWGAMLFFLLLDAAPAMDHPSADSVDSPRKKWLEVDSQILNALFCVTGFGLAPWRFRDLVYVIQSQQWHNKSAMKRICKQNESWFRPPKWYDGVDLEAGEEEVKRVTFTGKVAPPTSLWKLNFVVWMMILNTLFQAVLSFFMWHYNRINRPPWATGLFIALGCGVSLLAGLMMWWEGRKVKKIEGPVIIQSNGSSEQESPSLQN
ncbi:hypothetical protein ZTR_04918 [Talaromyces verruculosus]|nr:hypothetical protein ZTR_04918 [Talaromyces verruculosus]